MALFPALVLLAFLSLFSLLPAYGQQQPPPQQQQNSSTVNAPPDAATVLTAAAPAADTIVDSIAPKLAEDVPAPNPAVPTSTTPTATKPASTAPAKVPFWETATPFAPQGEQRRALPAPLDPVFPSSEFTGSASQTLIGIPDLNGVFPLEKEIYKACPVLKRARIEIYGWTNAGIDTSSSRRSNIPQSYSIVPRKPELDQQVFRVERYADTVQQDHNDWGFRVSMVYGIDTRYTVADGWYPDSGTALGQNKLYNWDPVELYGVQYIPKIGKKKLFDGLVIKYGRYISPPDIEAQLAPDNYLWTHSVMFTYDCYTQTGALASLKLNKQWMVQAGMNAGDDIAPWSKAAIPTGQAFVRWQAKNNRDSIYGGMNSINDGHYRLADKDNGNHGHDNLQQFNVTWGHRFSRRVHMMTEGYWIYQINALTGGTVISGPPRPYFTATGPGTPLPGMSQTWGLVNYTNFKVTDKDYITLRPVDILGDPRGVDTGFRATYGSWTMGWCHRFNDLLCVRPEIRYERALNTNGREPTATPYNDGTRRSQFTMGFDVIQRF